MYYVVAIYVVSSPVYSQLIYSSILSRDPLTCAMRLYTEYTFGSRFAARSFMLLSACDSPCECLEILSSLIQSDRKLTHCTDSLVEDRDALQQLPKHETTISLLYSARKVA